MIETATLCDTTNTTITLKAYRGAGRGRLRTVWFVGHQVHEDGQGNVFYATASGRLVAYWGKEQTITDYDDWETFAMELEVAQDLLADVAEALGIDYEYVEEIE